MEAFVLLCLLGGALFALGIYVRQGGYKRLYVTQSRLPVIAPEAYKNAFLPLGIATIAFALAMPPFIADRARDVFFYLGAGLFVLAIVLGILSPRWLKPRWLVYLEDTYGRVFIHTVLLPAAGKDAGGWAQRMRTLEDVKMWAASFAEQQGFPP